MPTLGRLLPVAFPAAEIILLIVVADQIGVGWTLVALAISALAGVLVIRVLGAATLGELRDALARREPPAGPLFRGACVLIAGMLLILPGFLSDVIALLLLMPPTRRVLTGTLWRLGSRRSTDGGVFEERGPTVIDGDYREVSPGDATTPPERRLDHGTDGQSDTTR